MLVVVVFKEIYCQLLKVRRLIPNMASYELITSYLLRQYFHESKVSDLVPELQGRFPIRVELCALGEEELFRILTEPKNSLVKQYQALRYRQPMCFQNQA